MKDLSSKKLGMLTGGISAASAAVDFLMLRWMATLPFGNNDFDLGLLGIMLAEIAFWIGALVAGLVGLIFSTIGLFRGEDRLSSVSWMLLSAFSMATLWLLYRSEQS